ncbi:MAG: flavin reductase family protein [Saprospiraceae bacterium]|nr:flavin reductase family protein [Saprospiraceae bacterium]
MKTFLLNDLTNPQRHQLMASAVAPRPIAFASTIDKQGRVNLSPFSFFNIVSTNPPVAVFSVSRRGFDGSLKDTHLNVLEIPEVAINMVSYAMVQQMSLSSSQYPRDVNEFLKAGFNMSKCDGIQPPYVAEAPVVFECRVREIISLGGTGAAGNMIICDIDRIKVREELLDSAGKLDTTKIDLVGRMGDNWYCRASGEAVFQVTKPSRDPAIGIDQLPDHIKKSDLLSANDLGILGSLTSLPTEEAIETIDNSEEFISFKNSSRSASEMQIIIHQQIKSRIALDQTKTALEIAFWAKRLLEKEK